MRVLNFAGGPALIPDEVLLEARESIWNHAETGVGILETGHRTPEFDRIMADAVRDIRTAGGIPESHEVLFLPGGAQMMFSLLPANTLTEGTLAAFLVTGSWPQRAYADAARLAKLTGATVQALWNGEAEGFRTLPAPGAWTDAPSARYLHYCSNNTIEGTQFKAPPETAAPLVCDATSEILSRPWPFEKHAMVFAGAQKNLGIAGVTIAVVDKAFLAGMRDELPLMLSLREHAKAGSRINTPPTFAIWMASRMAAWILRHGGVRKMAEQNSRKGAALYAAIDRSDGFYKGTARAEDRSPLNVSFRCATTELDAAFAAQAAKQGMVGLEGHRLTGGIRASMYNAMPVAGAEQLAQFMREFAKRNG